MSLQYSVSFLNISSTFFILIMTARIPHTSQPSCHLSNSSPSISRWTWVASNWETFTEWRPSFTFTKARLMSSTFSKAFAAVATPSITVSIYDRKQDGLPILFCCWAEVLLVVLYCWRCGQVRAKSVLQCSTTELWGPIHWELANLLSSS